jgi:hypothetical protein
MTDLDQRRWTQHAWLASKVVIRARHVQVVTLHVRAIALLLFCRSFSPSGHRQAVYAGARKADSTG